MTTIDWSPRERALREEYKLLSLGFSQLYTEHQDLINTVGPRLSAEYLQAVGELQYKVLQLQLEIKLLSMRESLLRQYVNRDETPDVERVNKELERVREEYNATLRQESEKLFYAKEYLKSPELSPDESKEIRRLYQTIVKLVHPDLHPESTEEMIEIFRRGTQLYKEGDLDGIRDLYNVVLFKHPTEGIDVTNGIEYEIEQLKGRIAKIKAKIEELWQTFPYTFAKELADPQWVEQRQRDLTETIRQLEDRKAKMQEIITLLEEYESQGF